MGLEQLDDRINWTVENIAPEGRPPHYITVGVLPKPPESEVSKGYPKPPQNVIQETIKKIGWALENGI